MSDNPNDAPQVTPPQTPHSLGDARVMAIVCYALFILTFTNGITAIAGVVLLYIKRGETRGTIWESHFTNLIQVFWIGIVVFVVFAGAMIASVLGIIQAAHTDSIPGAIFLLPLFWLCGLVYVVWYLYRTVKGLARAIDSQPYG